MNRRRTSTQDGQPSVLAIVCTALFFGVVNGSAVAVVLPEIGADLGIGDGDLSWVMSGFLLTYGVAIPFYGRLANRYGARRLFLVGLAVFAVGSALSAVATDLGTLLAARTIQAIGGAAVPGLGMTLASRAYPEARRGFVLGVVSATMGVAAAAGPPLAGVISEIADWRYLFAVSALSIVGLPLGIRYLDRNEPRTDGPLDLAGGVLFGLGVAGLLFLVTRGSQAGWTDGQALAGAAVSLVALGVFAVHQRRGTAPFIPLSLITNRRYLLLTLLGFAVTFANLAAQIGFPFLFSSIHGLSSLEIGLALLPAALATATLGIIAGRLVDRIGAAGPLHAGVVLMLVGAIVISSRAGSSAWTVAALAMVLGAGFALVNTPLATVVSLLARPEDLAAALSLNTMMFFIGGSFGSSLFTSIAINTGSAAEAVNPFHDGAGVGFSNAFAALVVPLGVALALGRVLRREPTARPAAAPRTDGTTGHGTRDCNVPWAPDLEPADAARP
ncbi:MAG: MFS transporter [Actinomycetota bacterium]